jgi:hypothetical protein
MMESSPPHQWKKVELMAWKHCKGVVFDSVGLQSSKLDFVWSVWELNSRVGCQYMFIVQRTQYEPTIEASVNATGQRYSPSPIPYTVKMATQT